MGEIQSYLAGDELTHILGKSGVFFRLHSQSYQYYFQRASIIFMESLSFTAVCIFF